MFPGLNPKKMQAVMQKMGIAQEEIDASKVIIETPEKNIIISNPSVIKINMQGQTNFQISGDIGEEESEFESMDDVLEEENEDTSEEDIKTIIEKTGCSEEQAKGALEKSDGDLTDALLSLG